MADVTRLLDAAAAGDRKAPAELLPLVYDELRKLAAARMASEAPDHTLQPTALVHEAYLRLVGDADRPGWDGRGHFFAAAAEAKLVARPGMPPTLADQREKCHSFRIEGPYPPGNKLQRIGSYSSCR